MPCVYKGAEFMKFSNGLNAVIKKNASVPVVSVNIWVRVVLSTKTTTAGLFRSYSRNLLFKGSKNYPRRFNDEKTLKKMGRIINAATSKDYTLFLHRHTGKRVR
jgi:predicted Zn-dependent peptidase